MFFPCAQKRSFDDRFAEANIDDNRRRKKTTENIQLNSVAAAAARMHSIEGCFVDDHEDENRVFRRFQKIDI